MTPHFDFVALTPEIIVASTFAIVLLVDLFIAEDKKRWALSALSFTGCMAAFVIVTVLGADGHRSQMFGGAYTVDAFSLLSKSFFTVSAALIFLFGLSGKWKGEYCQLILASVLGMMTLSSSRDLLLFFVSFELFALPAYILTGWNKKSAKGAEAALKYYLLGALATAVMLYGISFLYGIAGGTSFSTVAKAIGNGGDQAPLARISILFFIVGMAFKISAVPFHFWAPDAYQGAPIPVAAFLSVTSKIAGFVALMEVVEIALPGARTVWAPILFGLAIASMFVGNLLALRQHDAVRLLAYSAIAQTGYILIPLAVTHGNGIDQNAIQSTFEYLFIYGAANLGAFGVIAAVAKAHGSTDLKSFEGLFTKSPALATALTIFILSLAGIPPLGGWFAKFTVLRAALSVDTPSGVTIAVLAGLATATGYVFYLGFIRRLWLSPESADASLTPEVVVSPTLVRVILFAGIATVVAGILPGVVTHLGGWSSLVQ